VTAIPAPADTTVGRIYRLHAQRARDGRMRPYLGWSEIGEECDRALWLRFRWAEFEDIEGRIARLFDTGHREEARVLEELRAIGCTVWDRDEEGNQFGVASLGGHFQGHLDAVVEGLPEAPKTPHLVDVKTIKRKKMDELVKKGMRAVFPKYWAQAHGYMGHAKLTRAMFIFVCKDDDEIHVERFAFEKAELERFEKRAAAVIFAATPPAGISRDPAWFACKFCRFHGQCHGTTAPLVNCRTCVHSTPVADGTWRCERHGLELAGFDPCADHRFIPVLLSKFAEATDADGERNTVTYKNLLTGVTFTNGAPPDALASHEIRDANDKRILGQENVDPQLAAIRKEFGGTYAG